jgi:outer membrane protein
MIPTHIKRLLPLSIALGLAFAAPARAQSLVELYESARGFDAVFQSAKSQYDASLAHADQAKAGLLPAASLTVDAQRIAATSSGAPAGAGAGDVTYNTATTTLGATQPLYRPANLKVWEQAKRSMDIARETLTLAEQDLIVRTSQAYFDVLGAQDSLTFVKAQKAAVAEQLASAKRNFEVGTSTITDTREAQARYDLVIAQEIAAENDLRVKKITLDQLVGKNDTTPKPLAAPVVLPAVTPDDMAVWVKRSEETHPQVKIAQLGLDVAKLETDKARDGHKPTLDLTAGYSSTYTPGPSTSGPYNLHTGGASIGLNFTLPLFAGFAIQNRVKETISLEDKARSDLDNARRSVSLATRTAYLGVLSGQGQVKALEAAEASSQSALDANKLGYQVGVRINIDVLNAQSQLYQTKRDLAQARYGVLVGDLRLRQAAGSLTADDLRAANALLSK